MTAAQGALEQRLIHAYQEQLQHYTRALAVVDQQAPASTVSGNQNWVHDLHAALEDVQTVDAAMADDKSAWRLSGLYPGLELSTLLERVAHMICALADGIDRHMDELQAHKEQLLPEIDAFIQRRRMLEAYGQHG
jgi:hypothetical protein